MAMVSMDGISYVLIFVTFEKDRKAY